MLTEVAGKKINGAFGHLRQILAQYKHAGVQIFRHSEYEEYKCLGPYTAKWCVYACVFSLASFFSTLLH